MTDVEIYQAPRTEVAVVSDIDSWTQIAGQVINLSKEIADTPFVPDGLRGSVPAVAAAILAGRELGLPPLTSLANIHVIKGKPALSATLMRALVQAQGHQWEDVEVTDTRAVVRGRRRGEAEWTTVGFTADQARRARIDLGGYPQDKLYARATSRLARRKFADVIAGMPYSAEELEDGETGEGVITEPAASNGHAEPAKPASRTAQRRTRASADRPTTAAPAAATAHTTAPATAQTAPSDPALPPLPGEDEDPTDGPQPGTGSSPSESATGDRATPGWVGLIVKHFERLGIDDRDVRLGYTAQIAGRDSLASTKDLTPDQAKAVLDTLARCKDQERLILLMDKRERAIQGQDASGEPEPGSDG